MKKGNLGWIALLLASIVVATVGLAQELPLDKKTMSEKTGMQIPEKQVGPTPHHHHLSKLAGTWTGQVRIYPRGGEEARDSRSFAVSKMVLGDRFLRTEYKGDYLGHSVLGIGLDGFDTTTGEHVGIWADSMGTAITTLRGSCDESGKTITMYGESIDPATGKTIKSRSTTVLQSTSRYTYEIATLNEKGEYVPEVRIIFSKQ